MFPEHEAVCAIHSTIIQSCKGKWLTIMIIIDGVVTVVVSLLYMYNLLYLESSTEAAIVMLHNKIGTKT